MMKFGLKFIATYCGLSVLLLILAGQVVSGLRGEELSYLLWFYILNLILGLPVFPLLGLFVAKLNLTATWRIVCFFVLAIVLLNAVTFFANDSEMITGEMTKGLLTKDWPGFNFNVGGLHLIALISFFITMVIFRKNFVVRPAAGN